MDMKQHLLKLQIIRKLQQQSTREIWPDEENGSNPFVHFIEAFSSDDSMLLDRSQGDYQLLLGMPLEHPDSILIEARSQANKEKSSFPAAPLLTPRDELAEHYQLLLEMSPQKTKSDDNSRVRQTIMSQAPDFMRAALASLVPISISKMMVNQVYEGNYLIVRAISQAGSVGPRAMVNTRPNWRACHSSR
ncbi:hypothetical protein OPQ81_003242 [Rhizoctonia solani]|nr:hypothetical protein OPQ81_003242 [Rhizoctonia solani]